MTIHLSDLEARRDELMANTTEIELFFEKWDRVHQHIIVIALVYATTQINLPPSLTPPPPTTRSHASRRHTSMPVPPPAAGRAHNSKAKTLSAEDLAELMSPDKPPEESLPADKPSEEILPAEKPSEESLEPKPPVQEPLVLTPSKDEQDWQSTKQLLSQVWLNYILNALKVDPAVLPDEPTLENVHALSELLPAPLQVEAIHDLVLLSLSASHSTSSVLGTQKSAPETFRYSALDRCLVFIFAGALRIPPSTVYAGEKLVAQQLFFLMQASGSGANQDDAPQTDVKMASTSRSSVLAAARKSKWLRYVGAGAGVIVGGVALGLTGGLAAPLIAPMLVGLSGGALGFLATGGGAILIGTLFGVAGGGLTGYRAQRRLKGIEEFSFERLPDSDGDFGLPRIPSLHATVVCSGFLLTPTDYIDPWVAAFRKTTDRRDIYAIKLETRALLSAGKAVQSYVRDTLLTQGALELIRHALLTSVYMAVMIPAFIYRGASMTFDNDYQRARDKCIKAGILLADMIEQEAHGARPLTLIGSSMGTFTIFEAILELGRRQVYNLVDQVVLIGAPIAPSPSEWATLRSVVGRRVVNVYSTNDWVLAILARLHCLLSTRMSYQVMGMADVRIEGVDSIDISDLVPGHLEINSKMPEILERVGIDY